MEERPPAEAQQRWKEEENARENIRRLAMGEVPGNSADQEQVPVENLSSFSRLTDAAHWTDVAEVETRRCRLVPGTGVCAVIDGADWLQPFVDRHRQDAIRILDVPRAALSNLPEFLCANGRVFLTRTLLTHRGPASLAGMAGRFTEAVITQEAVREHLGY